MALDTTSIKNMMQNYPDFSGVVQIRKAGETLFGEAYGFANWSDEISNTLQTRFGIASGTKLLTGIAICQLVEQGKLKFESRLQEVLAIAFPQFDPAITVHHLLTHTSGVPDYFDEEIQEDYGALWQERPNYSMRTPDDFLPMFQNKPMKFAPSERFHYNNAGFILLGLIIEAISGKSYIDYVTQNVLHVAGMNDSGFFALNQLPARTALGYIPMGNGQWRSNIFEIPIIGGADGGVFVTAHDVGCLWDALFKNLLLSPAMTKKLLMHHSSYQSPSGNNRAYGYGIWMIVKEAKIINYLVEGADPGASFLSTVFPSQELEITVISNLDDGAWDVFHALLDLV